MCCDSCNCAERNAYFSSYQVHLTPLFNCKTSNVSLAVNPSKIGVVQEGFKSLGRSFVVVESIAEFFGVEEEEEGNCSGEEDSNDDDESSGSDEEEEED